MASNIVIRLLQDLLHGQSAVGTRFEDCWSRSAGAEGCRCRESALAGEGEGAVSTGGGAGGGSFVGGGSFPEDEEFDKSEQDQGEGELADEKAPGEGARGGWGAIVVLALLCF